MLHKLMKHFAWIAAGAFILSCNFSGFAIQQKVVPTATAQPIPEASATSPAATPTSSGQPASPTASSAEVPVTLDPCTLLTRDEASGILGLPVKEGALSGGACTYSDADRGTYVVSGYAFQGNQIAGGFSARLFLLSAFGMQFDQATLDQMRAWDQASDVRSILLKLIELSAGTTAFTSRSLDGLGELAYWAWKEVMPGVRQGFLIAVKGDVTAGVDLVHSDLFDEPVALDRAMAQVNLIFGRLPARFQPVMSIPTPQSPPTPTLVLPVVAEPAGGKPIAFQSERDGSPQIYTMNLDGSSPKRLTFTGANYSPAWSPDGTKIAFYSIRGETASLYMMNADGTGERMVFDNAFISGLPSWSPDGSRLAFTSRRDGNLEIYLVNLDGSGVVNFSSHPADDYEPHWSPDSQLIAFVSNRLEKAQIYATSLDGSQMAMLTHLPGIVEHPAWSPDGRRMAFVYGESGRYAQVYVMDIDPADLTRMLNLVNLTNNDMDNRAPAWSPDGIYVLFYAAGFQGNWDIYRMLFDGTQITNLTQAFTAHDSFPSWQP